MDNIIGPVASFHQNPEDINTLMVMGMATHNLRP